MTDDLKIVIRNRGDGRAHLHWSRQWNTPWVVAWAPGRRVRRTGRVFPVWVYGDGDRFAPRRAKP
jgi:hypothetical protein